MKFFLVLCTLLTSYSLAARAKVEIHEGEPVVNEPELVAELQQDIEELHAFFVGWYNGELEHSAFETEFAARLDPHFTIIMPSGIELDHGALMSAMRQSFGKNPGFRIEIRNVRLVHATQATAVATYEEWQRNEQRETDPGSARISTVTFSRGRKLQWLHVHETWLPDDVVRSDPFEF